MTNQELQAVIMPDSLLRLEWADTDEPAAENGLKLQREIYQRFNDKDDNWLFFLGFCDNALPLCPSLDYWRRFASFFVQKLCKTQDLEILRHTVEIDIAEDELEKFRDSLPNMTGSEYFNRAMLVSLWESLTAWFCSEIKSHKGSVAKFIKRHTPDMHLAGRVFFNLVENKKSELPFAFLATYSTGINQRGQSRHVPLKFALKEYEDDSEQLLKLLSTVYTAAKKSPMIDDLVESGELFHPLAWDAKEGYDFLREISICEESGILCRIPDWWRQGSAGVGLNISLGDRQTAFAGMNSILSFRAELLLGDVPVTEAEAKKLLDESEGLAFIKNKWVAVDHEKLRRTLEAYEKVKNLVRDESISIGDALRMQLRPGHALQLESDDVELTMTTGDWLESVLEKLRNPEIAPEIRPGRDFKASLRQYQQQGLNWLWFLHSLQFGACLADDMGLGKTVQLLAFLDALKKEGKKKKRKAALLVIPASIISNWIDEIEKFFPKLKYFAAHPSINSQNAVLSQSKRDLDKLDLVITTYALVQKYEWIKTHSWSYVILDEAQAIKNPGTKQTRAVKKLKADNRIIMTGTPIENRMGDLWSLFDFLNQGLLGSKNEFVKFAKGLKDDPGGYGRLRKVITPYMLRRLKTDKTIISDLPDKVELKTYASLSKKQIVLYENMIKGIQKSLEQSDGIQRKGLILASLTKFKQLCNHPDQYLGSGEYMENHSGKFLRLKEICETIYEKREKALIFTQFKEICEPLSLYLEGIFCSKGLVLHGSIPVKKRKTIIQRFQSDQYFPFMVLSLKAGGVGLNLTKASHVVHFDRWWNPAVENQATDRAFRIGQQKNVMVHKFITTGTVEEKIDAMLEEKAGLSKKIIAKTGEAWITEMDDAKVLDMFRLTL